MRALLWCVSVWAIAGCHADAQSVGSGPTTPPEEGYSPPSLTTFEPPPPRCPVAQSSESLVVPTEAGLVRGQVDHDTVSFKGIPFAAPPTGDLRFRPPAPAACWNGVRDATQFGSACLQPLPNNGTLGDEDCLFLNVWTPSLPTSRTQRRPVLFFIYGGAYVFGSGNQDVLIPNLTGNLYDGHALAAAQNAVVVTFNYRLGDLGFLAHPSLAAGDPHGSTSNYALLDQIAALTWVRDNIARFGGDPQRVTVFGESAGGQSVCMLLGSPLAHGLFSAAVMESGVCKTQSLDTAYQKGAATAQRVGCDKATDVAACLRAQPASSFVNPINGLVGTLAHFIGDFQHAWELGPTVDGWVLPQPPVVAMRAGNFNAVPLIVGNNADELELFTAGGLVPTPTCAGYQAELQTLFQDSTTVNAVALKYPCDPLDPDPMAPHRDLVVMGTDMMFRCPNRRVLVAAYQGSSFPRYRYLFSQTYSNNATLAALRSFHAAELMYLFGTFSAVGYTPTSGDLVVSNAMGNAWGQFAATASPNGANEPLWPEYHPALGATMELVDAPAASTEADPKCDFWDAYAPDW